MWTARWPPAAAADARSPPPPSPDDHEPAFSNVHFGHQGRVVIVTGGAQGIGEACVRRFAREEARLVIADVADAPGSALARELGATYMHCDVGDKLDVDGGRMTLNYTVPL